MSRKVINKMINIEQLKEFYKIFVEYADYSTTTNPEIAILIKWFTFYIIIKDIVNAESCYKKLLKLIREINKTLYYQIIARILVIK